jgi:hypothetical protein
MRWKPLTIMPLLAAVFAIATTTAASADPTTDALRLSHSTAAGVHNTYDKNTFAYLADALDSGTGLIELDVWADSLLRRWRVNHDLTGTSNNCVAATTAAQLRTGSRDQNLGVCLDDIRLWHDTHPGHRPIIVKVELKAGFDSRVGLGAADFDRLVSGKLGSMVYRPADLLTKPDGSQYGSLDAASLADNWATRADLAGKVLFELIPGTFERGNPFDHLATDVEYAQYLKALQAAGQIGAAQSFPAVLDAAAGDPRARYSDPTLRPWFVVFDGAASSYVGGGIDTGWYDTGHYLLIMTDAASVPPALDAHNPPAADAAARVALLARAHATIVSTDWSTLPTVLSTVLPRG